MEKKTCMFLIVNSVNETKNFQRSIDWLICRRVFFYATTTVTCKLFRMLTVDNMILPTRTEADSFVRVWQCCADTSDEVVVSSVRAHLGFSGYKIPDGSEGKDSVCPSVPCRTEPWTPCYYTGLHRWAMDILDVHTRWRYQLQRDMLRGWRAQQGTDIVTMWSPFLRCRFTVASFALYAGGAVHAQTMDS